MTTHEEQKNEDQLSRVIAKVIATLQPKEPNAVTLDAFWERWIREYCKANRQKPRGIEAKISDLKINWLPRVGDRPLNLITDEDIQRFKADCEEAELDRKTVNNKLSTLNKLLKTAVAWSKTTGLQRMPVTITMFPIQIGDADFYDFEQWERLVKAARGLPDPRHLAVVLLGGDAGLRLGEIIGLEWEDWRAGVLDVRRSQSGPYTTLPKSGRARRVSTTETLAAALELVKKLGHKGQRVLSHKDGAALSQQTVRTLFFHVQRAAGIVPTGLHILRHTFCSHLAMRGAAPRAIQELAGHSTIRVTERYMHLSPVEADRNLKLLDSRPAHRTAPVGPIKPIVRFDSISIRSPGLLSLNEIAKQLRVREATIRRWVLRGPLEGYYSNGELVVRESELARFLASRSAT